MFEGEKLSPFGNALLLLFCIQAAKWNGKQWPQIPSELHVSPPPPAKLWSNTQALFQWWVSLSWLLLFFSPISTRQLNSHNTWTSHLCSKLSEGLTHSVIQVLTEPHQIHSPQDLMRVWKLGIRTHHLCTQFSMLKIIFTFLSNWKNSKVQYVVTWDYTEFKFQWARTITPSMTVHVLARAASALHFWYDRQSTIYLFSGSSKGLLTPVSDPLGTEKTSQRHLRGLRNWGKSVQNQLEHQTQCCSFPAVSWTWPEPSAQNLSPAFLQVQDAFPKYPMLASLLFPSLSSNGTFSVRPPPKTLLTTALHSHPPFLP